MELTIIIVLCLLALLVLTGLIVEVMFVLRGKQFALRDPLQKADAIVVLAGTRGNINYLDGKISTGVKLYQAGWAPVLIGCGAFSVKITETATRPFTEEELEQAVASQRLQQKDVAGALKNWDKGLGASYIVQKAQEMGVPPTALLTEDTSLHTRENAEHVLALLKQHRMQTIILVTSPFHQKRTSLTFAKVFQPHEGLRILNYYAQTDEWHPATWFFSREHRKLVKSEIERINLYRQKGDLL